MKVEFWSSPEGGAELLIPASEFAKAQKGHQEFLSLVHATEAFAMLLGFDYSISEREYEVVTKKLKKGDTVILSFREAGGALFEVSSADYHIEEISLGGRIVGHVDPSAIERIRARHEKEAKRK